MNWYTIRSIGFAYQEVYLDANSIMVGSVTKAKGATRYTAFFCNGKVKMATTRGSARTAREWVDGQYNAKPEVEAEPEVESKPAESAPAPAPAPPPKKGIGTGTPRDPYRES